MSLTYVGLGKMHQSSVIFCHIPKTGGRYFWENTFKLANHTYLSKVGQFKGIIYAPGNAHVSPRVIDEHPDALSFLLLREPVKRMVSHWNHLHREDFDRVPSVKEFLDYAYSEESRFLHNYQTRYLAFNDHSEDVNISTEPSSSSVITEEMFALSLERVRAITHVMDVESLDEVTILKHRTSIYNFLGMEENYDTRVVTLNSAINPMSKAIYDKLSKSDKHSLSLLMEHDYELLEETFKI